MFVRAGIEEGMPNTQRAQEFGTNRTIVVNAAASGRNATGLQPVPE